jgi:ribosomal protein S18 acetylase RimI-like enzyme
MRLREATMEDAATLLRLMHSSFEEYLGLLDPPSAAHDETVETVRERLKRGSAVVAFIDDEPAGFAFYHPQDSHLYFGRLSVLPQYRQRGVGRTLVEYVEKRAMESGSEGVRLGVRVQLPHLKDWYERLGYTVTKYVAHDGHSSPTYMLMEKRLG